MTEAELKRWGARRAPSLTEWERSIRFIGEIVGAIGFISCIAVMGLLLLWKVIFIVSPSALGWWPSAVLWSGAGCLLLLIAGPMTEYKEGRG